MALRWRLYYGDGTTFSDSDGPWDAAPSLNVQALITESDEVGYEVNEGSGGFIHNYIWWPGEAYPWGVDQYGTLDYLVAVGALAEGDSMTTLSLADLTAAGVKLGRSISTDRWREIISTARADDYFPTKQGRTRAERPADER